MTQSGTRKRVLAVVPAKGTSRRAPGKNMAPLAGLPMFCQSVRLALAAELIDEVLVSSDSEQILSIATQHGARPIPRPPELCSDEATNFQVLRHLLEVLRQEEGTPELLVLLQPTTPFRTPVPLNQMVATMLAEPKADALVTVSRVTRVLGRIQHGYWLPDSMGEQNQRMKNAAQLFAISGHAFLVRPDRTLDQGSLLGSKVIAHPVPDAWLDIDVDTPEDLVVARAVAACYFKSHFP